MYTKIKQCRICGNPNLALALDLGEQMLTGVFPREKSLPLTAGPLRLVKCDGGNEVCGLLQLEHSFDLAEMYGENYGYRSGLNPSMVSHLRDKVARILKLVTTKPGDLIVDIGSNDSTTLQFYPGNLQLVGVDPTGTKFKRYYPEHIQLIPDFFSSKLVKDRFPMRRAKVVTSFSMFYDLESPMDFMREVHEILEDDGIWVFEQSYLPAMLRSNSYDTVCHEHLEFYALRQIQWMAERVGFRIVDVEFNGVNGGSFSVTMAKSDLFSGMSSLVEGIISEESEAGLNSLAPFAAFADRVSKSKLELIEFVSSARSAGKTVAALGASTKGNVLLQYCGLTAETVQFVGEVNSEKFGCMTPGTWIPIIPEQDLLKLRPDYLIVLPWHFREFFLNNERFAHTSLVFPLPILEVHERRQKTS